MTEILMRIKFPLVQMNKDKKVLFVSRALPYPVIGGDSTVFESVLKVLAEIGRQADLLCYTRTDSDLSYIEEAKEKLNLLNIFYTKIEPKINFRCVFDWLFKEKSYIFNRFYSKKFSGKLLELVKTGEYSKIVFEHAYMFVNLLFNPDLAMEIKKQRVETIINSHVLEYFVFEQGQAEKKFVDYNIINILADIEQKYLKKIELECIKNADKTIFLSEEDMQRVQLFLPDEFYKFNLLEITPFIDNYFYSEPEFEEKNSIYFMGTFSWKQNYDSLMYFINDIFPLIIEKNPDIKLYLVGKNANKRVEKLHNGKNIFFIGEVEKIFEEIKKYSVLVMPLRLKGGTRIKILESIAWGKAIVCTPESLEGMAICGENPVVTAESPQDFSQKVLELVEDDKLRLAVKQNARKFACKYYSFERFRQAVSGIFIVNNY